MVPNNLQRYVFNSTASKAWRRKTVPSVFKPEECSDRVKRIPYEAYFRYWRIYIFAEALSDGYDRIDRFLLDADGGIGHWKNGSETNDYWEKTYEDAFDRLSYYQAAKAMFGLPPYGQVWM